MPGRLAQPALPLQKIAAFDSLARNLRSKGHVRVKFLEGHRGLRVFQGAQKWPTVSVLLDGNSLKSRRKAWPRGHECKIHFVPLLSKRFDMLSPSAVKQF